MNSRSRTWALRNNHAESLERMQRDRSPWRDMLRFQHEDRRLDYAKVVVAAPAMLGLFGLATVGITMVTHRGSLPLPGARVALALTATSLLLALHVLAAWGIGQRRAVGGYLALGLFTYGLVMAAWHRRLFSLSVAYDVLAIWLVMGVAPLLGMRWPGAAQRWFWREEKGP